MNEESVKTRRHRARIGLCVALAILLAFLIRQGIVLHGVLPQRQEALARLPGGEMADATGALGSALWAYGAAIAALVAPFLLGCLVASGLHHPVLAPLLYRLRRIGGAHPDEFGPGPAEAAGLTEPSRPVGHGPMQVVPGASSVVPEPQGQGPAAPVAPGEAGFARGDEGETGEGAILDESVLSGILSLEYGAPNLLACLVDRFLDQSPAHLETLRAALQEKAWPELRNAAQSLRTNSSLLGARTLADLCRNLEVASVRGADPETEMVLALIEEQFGQVCSALARIRREHGASSAGGQGPGRGLMVNRDPESRLLAAGSAEGHLQ